MNNCSNQIATLSNVSSSVGDVTVADSQALGVSGFPYTTLFRSNTSSGDLLLGNTMTAQNAANQRGTVSLTASTGSVTETNGGIQGTVFACTQTTTEQN